MMTIKAAALMRVSTKGQAGQDRFGLDVQRRAIRDYASRNELEVTQEYVDIESGSSERRESFYRLLSEADQYQAVVFFDSTRLARSEELAHRFIRLLGEAGLELHATNRGVVEAGLLASIDMAMSAEERRNIARRLYGGITARADAGLPPLGLKLYGYRNIPKSKPEIDPESAAVIRRLFAIAAEEGSFRAAARRAAREGLPTRYGAALWSHRTVQETIRNPAYKGELIWPRNGKRGTAQRTIEVPAIVSPEVWRAAQKAKGVGSLPKGERPLSGRLKCGVCGFGFSVQRKAGKVMPDRYYYRCNSRGRTEGKCSLPSLRARDVEEQVELELRAVFSDEDRLVSLLEAAKANQAPDPRLVALQERERGFVEALGKGDLTPAEFGILRRQVRAEIASFEQPTEPVDYRLSEYREAAKTRDLKGLLDMGNPTIVVLEDGFRVILNP